MKRHCRLSPCPAGLGLLFLSTLFVSGGLAAREAMTLDEVLREVVSANLRLRVSELDHRIAAERAKAEWAIFEPVLLVTLAGESNERENTAEKFLSQRVSVFEENNRIYSTALEGQLPTGGTVRLGLQTRGLENNLQAASVRREWESFSGVTLTQPLLRDRGWEAVATQIRLAASDSAVALQDYRGQIALVLSAAERAYWDLAATVDFVSLRESSVAVAEAMLADNRERLEAGKTTRLEVLQAEAGLALRQSRLAEARQRQVDAEARLEAFRGRRATEGGGLVPSEPIGTTVSLPPRDEALARSFRSHPAYRAQLERCQQAGIRLAFAENQRLPRLDLKASYGLNGLSDSLGGTFETGWRADRPSWYVGFELRYPLFDSKRERHQVQAAKMRQRQALLELSAIEVELMNGVHVLLAQVASLSDRAGAMAQVVALQERVLADEQEALAAGKSESRRVLQAEEDLSEARLEALAARLDLRRALVELSVQQGSYLAERGFELLDEGA
jgi:outer membrane protein